LSKDKVQFVARVAEATSLTRAQVRKVLKAMQDVSAESIRVQGHVSIRGLVNIRRIDMDARIRRLPGSAKSFVAPPSLLVKARPLPSFRERVKAENPVQN
jgi:nucleoid DNA-binding protein